MSYISITLGGVSKNSGSYLTSAQTIGIKDTFSIKFTVKNTNSERSIRYMSIRYDWMYDDTITGSKYVKGSGLSGKASTYGSSISTLDEGKSVTYTLPSSGGLSASDMGMTATSKANKLRINIAGWISSDSGGPHFSGYYDITSVTYQGEAHNPTIVNFLVKRVSNESTQLTITGYGTHTVPSDAQFSDTLVFQYSTDNGSSWTTNNNLFTLAELLANTTKTWSTSTFSLPTTSRAIFKITFGNDYETKAVATSSVNTSKAVIHLYGSDTGGVGFGRYCSAENRFDCNYPAYFYQPVTFSNGITNSNDEYQKGTTISLTGGTFYGYVTSSTTSIRFNVQLKKSLKNISSATVTALTANIANNGGYAITSSAVDGGSSYISSAITITCTVYNGDRNEIQIQVDRSSDWDLTNNDSVQVRNELLTLYLS